MKDARGLVKAHGRAALTVRADVAELLRDWLGGVGERTRAAYSQDLAAFAEHLGVPGDPTAAVRELVRRGATAANLAGMRWRNAMAEAGKAPATINRRLAALRSAVALLRVAGAVSWTLEVKGVKGLKLRDTRGCGVDGVRAILRAIVGDGEKAFRDRALVHLLFTMGLRRGEAVSLDVEHVDFAGLRLWVRGKARGGEREALTMPTQAADALRAYMNARENPTSGPVFTSCDRAGKGDGRLAGDGVLRVVRSLGVKAGLGKVRPHGLRHAAITAALDAGRDVREVLRFSRHRDPRTLFVYDDNRTDAAGKCAATVAALL